MAVRIPQPTDLPEPTGRIEGDTVIADGLATAAPEFVTRARETEDASEIGRLCQEAFDIGVAAWRTVQVDSEVRRAVDLLDRFETGIKDATARAVESVRAEMDVIARPEGGLLAGAVTREMAKLSETLEAAFAQEDKTSVLSRVEQAITAAAGAVMNDTFGKMQRLVDPSIDESPMGRLAREITQGIRPGIEAVTSSVNELRQALKVTAAVAEEQEKGTQKGRSYEDLVFDALAEIATVTGDVVERVATEGGALGRDVGDHVVVAKGPTGPVRVVFEAKDKAGMSRREVKRELDEAAENRQASVAVMVFAAPVGVTGQMPLVKLDTGRYAVVYDKANLDHLALRVAYQQARHEALAAPAAEVAVDLQELGNRVDQARRILDQITEVKKGHGQITSGLKHATDHLERLRQDLGTALDRIVECIELGQAGAEGEVLPE